MTWNWNIKNTQKGDTIVEVLLAVAVVSSVLAIAYSTMNRNILIMRDNQERTEASKLAQGQIESLKQAWATKAGQDQITVTSDPFCMNGGVPYSAGGGTVTTDLFADNMSGYSGECRSLPPSDYYRIGIRRISGSYVVHVRWEQAGRAGRGEVVMAYRLD